MAGLKFDTGKPGFWRAIRLFHSAISGACRAAEYGYKKYVIPNPGMPDAHWREVEAAPMRYFDGFMRHLIDCQIALSYMKEMETNGGRNLTVPELEHIRSRGWDTDEKNIVTTADAVLFLVRDAESDLLHTDHLAWNGLAISTAIEDRFKEAGIRS